MIKKLNIYSYLFIALIVSDPLSIYGATTLGEIPVLLESVHNKMNQELPPTAKQKIELSIGKLVIGDRKFGISQNQKIKDLSEKNDKPEVVNIPLKESQDYFFKIPADNVKALQLAYFIIDNKEFHLLLTRHMIGAIKSESRSIILNLKKLSEEKQQAIQSIQLKLVVDGLRFEKSSIEAIPVFEEKVVEDKK
jgi:hypothetical protein